MIPAAKNRWIAGFLARDAESRLKKEFGAVRAAGLGVLRSTLSHGPALVVSNHTSWWDPIVLQWICNRVLVADAFAMMDAKNLERLPFFRMVGAFGVDLEDARDGVRAMRYAAKLLTAPNRLVWVFPQGKEVPITQRPLGFRPGAAAIARIAHAATIVPAALRYEFGSGPKPELWLSFGAPFKTEEKDPSRGVFAQEAAVLSEMDRIEQAIQTGEADLFERLHQQAPGVVFRMAEATLAWLTRPRTALP